MLGTSRRSSKKESGAAVVEFALLTLLFVPLTLYAVFLAELSLAKLKAQEAGRYMVWEMTAIGLSDWADGDHDKRFTTARDILIDEMQVRYADDMQSATPTVISGSAPKPLSLKMSFTKEQTQLLNTDPELWNVGKANGFNTGALQKGVDWVFRQMKFNTKGKIDGSLKVHIKNTYLGKTMPIFYQEKMLLSDEFDLPVHESIIADQWDLKDGSAVAMTNQSTNCEANGKAVDYCRQVQRMYFLSLANRLSFLSGNGLLNKIMTFIGYHNPLDAVVASKPLTGNSDRAQLELDAYNPDDHSTIRQHETNVYKDTVEGTSTSDAVSPYTKVYNKRGKYFLGCKDAQKPEGTCNYR